MEQRREAYLENLHGVSEAIHPFALSDSSPQTAPAIQQSLEDKARAFEKIARRCAILDSKGILAKFRKQFTDLASGVSVWWVWVAESLSLHHLDHDQQDWLLQTALPAVYWHHQMEKTAKCGAAQEIPRQLAPGVGRGSGSSGNHGPVSGGTHLLAGLSGGSREQVPPEFVGGRRPQRLLGSDVS
jgi:hypothetical protein